MNDLNDFDYEYSFNSDIYSLGILIIKSFCNLEEENIHNLNYPSKAIDLIHEILSDIEDDFYFLSHIINDLLE